MNKHVSSKQSSNTSWNKVSDWYDELLTTDADSYQSKVIAPNLLRILDLKKGEYIYDLACGQGYFANIFAQSDVKVIASDMSKRLIEKAIKSFPKTIEFHITPAHKAPFLKDHTLDVVVIVLAIQNIENVSEVIALCARVLKKSGRLVLVLNHPSFRVPQGSDWYFKDSVQSRLISKYLSESKVSIDMTPGEKDLKKKIKTISFHRSLQYYVKLLSKNGFAITRLEEWISHKKSQNGSRQSAEDTARKEIPLFMCIEVKLLN
jgi:ubiquinone/menaquinone biosynthesis C-methylase UbiE